MSYLKKHIASNDSAYKQIFLFSISFALLFFTIKNSHLQWNNLLLNARQWLFLFLSMLVLLLSVWLQSERLRVSWRVYFEKSKPDTFNGLLLGNFYNALLPGNLGELIRARHFSKKNNVSFLKALASQVVEKYIDLFNFVIYTTLIVLLFQKILKQIWVLKLIGAGVLVVALFYLFLIKNKKAERFFMRYTIRFLIAGKWLFKLHLLVKNFLFQMKAGQWLWYIILGFCMFFLNVLQYYLVMEVVSLPADIKTFKIAFLIACSMILVLAVPSAPGNLGVAHLGIYSTLLWAANGLGLGVNENVKQSLGAYAIYLHLSYFIPEIIIGFIVLLKERKWII